MGLDLFARFVRRQAAGLQGDARLGLARAAQAGADGGKRQGEDDRRHTRHVALFPRAPE